MRRCAATLVTCATLLSSTSAFAQFVQQGSKLIGTGASGSAEQGWAVAVSGDGNTAIAGGPLDGPSGAAWIFTRSGSTWTQQGEKLVGTGAQGANPAQGGAVALSADGNTAIVGGPTDNDLIGAAWIFTRSNGVWTQQGSKLVGGGAVGGSSVGPLFGSAVALSADGNTALVSGPSDNGLIGAVWVFTRSNGAWTQQGSKLVGSGATAPSYQGVAVALSADGNTAIVGADLESGTSGRAWVFTRSGTTWTQQGFTLSPNVDGVGAPEFGSSVALSADGNTAAVGGKNDNSKRGAVWIFTRSGSTWTQQGEKLVAFDFDNGLPLEGSSVSLSGNGNVLFEGGPGDEANTGAVWAFVRSNGTWSQLGDKLVGTGAVTTPNGSYQGQSTALSADGSTAIVGGLRDDGGVGAVWIFTRTPPALPPHAFADFDGDHVADVTVYKGNGDWATLRSAASFGSSSTVNWGGAGYVPVRGDFDGDGLQDPALYNPATGTWRIATSVSNYTASTVINWGGPGYAPVPGDYDGDGKTDIAVYNIATGAWLILKSSTSYTTAMTVTYGGAGYTAIPGQDFDGDLTTDIAVYQQSTGLWSVLKSSTAYATGFSVAWGGPGYTLVPGDYDGDHRADLGLYRRDTGGWYILTSSSSFTNAIGASWGGPGYNPVPGDYDGDGKTDLGIYQPATGNWSVLKSSTGFTTTLSIAGWGSGGDMPITPAIDIAANDMLRGGDFDGDGRSEITVYNSSSGVWSSLTSTSGYTGATNRGWGGLGYQPVPGDYDGDGKADLAIYQLTTGNWYVLLSGSNFTTSLTRNVGGSAWVPAQGDYDGDGKTDFVVYNPGTGQWYGLKSGSNYTTSVSIFYGGTNYFSVPGDYDGDGRSDIAVYNGSTGAWSVLLSSTSYTTSLSINVGGVGYSPVPADYDGDGRTDFVVYQLSTGLWYGLKSGSNYTTTINIHWGGGNYIPVKGDYDGDGKADIAAYESNAGTWAILLSSSNYTTTITKNWGGSGYLPVPR